MGIKITGRNSGKKRGKKKSGGTQNQYVFSEQTHGQAKLRLVTTKKRLPKRTAPPPQVQTQPTVVAPRRARHSVQQPTSPPQPEALAPQPTIDPDGAVVPEPEALSAEEIAASIPTLPVQVMEIAVDDSIRTASLSAAAFSHGMVFAAAGHDEHGQPLYELRPEAAVRADREVRVRLLNRGPPARVALLGFHGGRLRLAEVTLGAGVEAEVALLGPIHGHIELGYAPV